MDYLKVADKFIDFLDNNKVISISYFKDEKPFIDELVKKITEKKINVLFVPTSVAQAKQLHDLDQKTISLNDREIDVAIEFVDQVDNYNNFLKSKTNSFIRDKMIAQSAYNLIVVTNKENLVENINQDIYIEISTFAWQRTILNLQSYGFSRIVTDMDDNFVKTEIGHYLSRITLDKNMSYEDFESSIRTVPGVLETGVFLGLCDTVFLYNEESKEIEIDSRFK